MQVPHLSERGKPDITYIDFRSNAFFVMALMRFRAFGLGGLGVRIGIY
jgi:hypothetical protein